ncbi:extracellular solute-binding protein [Paenibacillus sp. H1-7]|uniref:ABC transporter substrate-binding protein n=1 Tax=Paenibacillus sp. H1-7 TaxID=2282849 RepID=UPI001EF86D76|nr:extracellular solute-binding protein [Paenibacillus sp. H1-7]ULL16297.1 extracellular solute-binding protein [Paenibacillus sp. H1-7]
MRKRNKAGLIVPAVLLAVITACNGGEKTTGDLPAAQAEAFKMGSEPIELFIVSASGDSVESFNDRFLDLVKEKYPNVNFTYLPWKKEGPSIQEMITAGQQIDIYYDSIGIFSTVQNYQLQMDMTELIKKHNVNLGSLEPATVDAAKIVSGGKEMWGVPVFNNNLVMYYNKDLFDKFGVAYPKDQMTWDELNELSKKLGRSDESNVYVGYTTSANHALRMNQMSLPYLKQDTLKSAISSDPWKKYYETAFLVPYKASGLDAFTAKNNRLPNFLTQEAAMFMYLSSAMFINKEYETLNWDMVPIPTLKEAPGVGSQPYPTFFGVTSTSKHKDEAMEIIKYLISEEVQMKLSKKGIMPVLNNEAVKKAFGQDSKFKNKNLKAVFTNQFAPVPYKSKLDSLVEKTYNEAVGTALNQDINTALRTAEEKANQLLSSEANK